MSYLKLKAISLLEHRKSLENKLFIMNGLFVILWIIGIVVILYITGVFHTINNQSYNDLEGELTLCEKNLIDRLIIVSQNTYNLASDINENINYSINKEKVSVSDITTTPELLTKLLDTEVEKSVFAMEKSGASGTFLILNSTINPSLANSKFSKAGFYIKDTDSSHISYINNVPVLLRGSSEIARKYDMYLDTEWQLEFDLNSADSSDFYYKPFNMANMYPDKNIMELGYFSSPFYPDSNQKRVITFSVPLIDKKGLVYGVCGLEISEQFLTKHLGSSSGKNDSTTFIFTKESNINSITMDDTVILGKNDNSLLQDDTLMLNKTTNKYNIYTTQKGYEIQAISKKLNIYNSKNPFSDENWLLLGYSSKETEPLTQAQKLYIAIILLALICITLSVKMSKAYLKPINSSFEQIKNNPTNISKTDIPEIDALIDFIENINRSPNYNSIKKNEKLSNTTISPIENENTKLFKSRLDSLTKTEKAIFDLYIKGLSTKEILEDRAISISTLKSHSSKIYSKMDVKSKANLLSYCYQMMNDYGKK